MADGLQTRMQRCIERLKANAADPASREELLQASRDRLLGMARAMLRTSPVNRWEQSNDLVQQVQLRMLHCFDNLRLESLDDFLRLAADNMRKELIDMRRSYFRQSKLGANHATPGDRRPDAGLDFLPAEVDDLLEQWGDLHEVIQQLDEEQRRIVDLYFYHGLTHDEIASYLGISVRTSKRLWAAARLELQRRLRNVEVAS